MGYASYNYPSRYGRAFYCRYTMRCRVSLFLEFRAADRREKLYEVRAEGDSAYCDSGRRTPS